jgi:hypothetical protein
MLRKRVSFDFSHKIIPRELIFRQLNFRALKNKKALFWPNCIKVEHFQFSIKMTRIKNVGRVHINLGPIPNLNRTDPY